MSRPTNAEQLDKFLEQHRRIRQLLPATWNAFFAKFGTLRPGQLATIPTILRGDDVLLTAPTAGGKTEAVMAPLCERLVYHNWPGLSTLVVTPTRALVNDLFLRLKHPLQEIGVKVGRKTSDHAISATSTERVLITTPESLESLLTFRRERLRDLRALIIDEIHLLDGTARGDQLRIVLSRLAAMLKCVHPADDGALQRIAMSATLANPHRVAAAYLAASASVIQIPGQRKLDARVVEAVGDEHARAQAAIESLKEWESARKVLVFVNSRQQVDLAARHFAHGVFATRPVYGHHGSLSKAERERVESRFREDHNAICVATMTLEIGIDIGDVDLVICVDPPFSLSSFLQRIGRGCRRNQGTTRVLCLARDRASELIFRALLQQAGLGIPDHPVAPLRRSVLAQQVLAYLRQVGKNRRTRNQFVHVFHTEATPAVTEDTIEQLLQNMVDVDLLRFRQGVYSPGKDGWEFIESNKIFSNISSSGGEVTLVDADSGVPVAIVRDLGGAEQGVLIGGRSYNVLPGGGTSRRLVRHGGTHVSAPRYRAAKLPYSFDIGACLTRYLACPVGVLWLLRRNDQIVIFTWLGRLLNSTLAAGLQLAGERAVATAFAIIVSTCPDDGIINKLQQAIGLLRATNPLADTPVEKMVDVGAHARLLGDLGMRKVREEWLDTRYLESWINTTRHTEWIDPSNARHPDLEELSLK